MPVSHQDKSDYELMVELDMSPAEFYDNPDLSWLSPSEQDVIEAQCMSDYFPPIEED